MELMVLLLLNFIYLNYTEKELEIDSSTDNVITIILKNFSKISSPYTNTINATNGFQQHDDNYIIDIVRKGEYDDDSILYSSIITSKTTLTFNVTVIVKRRIKFETTLVCYLGCDPTICGNVPQEKSVVIGSEYRFC
jgi:hypothetical protein